MLGNLRFLLLLVALIGLTAAPTALHSQSEEPTAALKQVTLFPTDDATIASQRSSERLGSAADLRLGYSGINGAERILLRFDIANGLPKNIVIQNAVVVLYQNDATPDLDAPMGAEARRLDESWSEAIVTWNNQPNIGGLRGTVNFGRTNGQYEINITTLVEDWVSGVRANNGLIIIGDERPSQLRERVFNSEESFTSSPFKPQLIVEYQEAAPPEATVNPLPSFTNSPSFVVGWTGKDNSGTGLKSYDIYFRFDDSPFVLWLDNTTATSALFTPPFGDGAYYFEAVATDNRDVSEPRRNVAEAYTVLDSVPPFMVTRAYLPLLAKD